MKILIGIVYIAICVFLMAVVLRQEGKQQGLGAIGGGNADTYWAKNKGRSREGVLKRMTVAAAVGFIILSVALNLLFKGDTVAATTDTQEVDIEQLTELLGGEVTVDDDGNIVVLPEDEMVDEDAITAEPGVEENDETTYEEEKKD